jgi:hypothetical protein
MTVLPGAPNITTTRANRGPPRIRRTAEPLQNPNVQSSERLHGEGCWPHLWVHSLSWGGPGGHCRYLKDRVPPRISFKSKMKDKTGAHARMSRGSHLLAQGSSRAATCLIAPAPATRARGNSETATCPVASAPISWHREAPGPSRASWLQLPPPGPTVTSGLPRAPWPQLPSPSMGQL